MIEKNIDNIDLKVYETREEMGIDSAKEAANCIEELLEKNEEINCIFAAAPSQSDFISELIKYDLPWDRINAFHMDEYVGLEIGHKQSFNHFLSTNIFDKVPFKSIHLIDGSNNSEKELERYRKLLSENPTHITFMGIGENGHIAFNDPHVAKFNDPLLIKKVELDHACRQQQVNDGCFETLEDVPAFAYTVTIPRLVDSEHIFCIVPTRNKHNAVKATLFGEISEACPASILRKIKNVRMYVDKDCIQNLF